MNLWIKITLGVLSLLLIIALIFGYLQNRPNEGPDNPSDPAKESTVQTEPSKKPTTSTTPSQTKPTETKEPASTTESTSEPTTEPTTEPSSGNGGGSGNGSDSTKETEPQPHFHKYKETVVKPTCTHQGYTLYECSCGANYKDNNKEALGHKYTTKTIAPTADSKGYTLFTCSVCGEEYKDNFTDPIPEETTKPTEPQETEPTAPSGGGGGGSNYQGGGGTPETEDYGFCPECGIRIWTTWYPQGCFTYWRDTVCSCGVLVHAFECHHH